MPFRYATLTDGTPLQGLFGSAGPFTVPAADHLQNLADAHGLLVADVLLVETDIEPDLSTAQPPLPVTPTPFEAKRALIRALADADPATLTLTQVADAVQHLIRHNGV